MPSPRIAPALALPLTLLLAPAAEAQLVGPVPGPAEASPAWTRPATPPPRTGADPAPESAPAAPSLVQRDGAGRLVNVPLPEDAAIAAYPFEPAQRARVDRALAARRRELDRWVANHLEQVWRVREMAPKALKAEAYSPLFEARDAGLGVRFTERPLDRLQRDGAITALQRARLDAAVKEYLDARAAQAASDGAGDAARQGLLTLRHSFADATRESVDSLERQLAGAAAMLPGLAEGLPLSDDDKVALAAIAQGTSRIDAKAADADARRLEVMAAEFPRLGVGARKTLLLKRLERVEQAEAPDNRPVVR